MKFKYLAIVIGIIILCAGGFLFVRNIESRIVQSRVDPLYIYFHKLQDSIRAKHYPINMDSLKKEVHDSMMQNSTFHKLEILADSVRAYKTPGVK